MERKVNFYKVLNESGCSYPDNTVKWSLPTLNKDGSWIPGEWTSSVDGELKEYSNGYHVVNVKQLLNWLGPRIFKVEVDQEIIDCGDICITRRCRLLKEYINWNDDEARKFASNCVEYILALYEKIYPDNVYLYEAIDAARFLTNAFKCKEVYIHKINCDHIRQWVYDIFSRSVKSKTINTITVDSQHSKFMTLFNVFVSLTSDNATSAAKLTARAVRDAVFAMVLAELLANDSSIEEARARATIAMAEAEQWQIDRLSKILDFGEY